MQAGGKSNMVHADVPGGESVEVDAPLLQSCVYQTFSYSDLSFPPPPVPRPPSGRSMSFKESQSAWWEASDKSNHCCLKQMNRLESSTPPNKALLHLFCTTHRLSARAARFWGRNRIAIFLTDIAIRFAIFVFKRPNGSLL